MIAPSSRPLCCHYRLEAVSCFLLLALFTLLPQAFGQYQWTNFAGLPGGFGNVDGTGNAARFNQPWGSAFDASGNLYIADSGNHVIRKVTPAGVVTTLAGQMGVNGFANGTGTAAQFSSPSDVEVDASGNVLVVDRGNGAIRKITPAGVVTTLAGNGGAGSANGTGAAAQFFAPQSLALDGSGNAYVCDAGNCLIRKVTPAGVVTTLAGAANQVGTTDGTGSAARFNSPLGIVFDGTDLYVCDQLNSTIRKVTLAGVVTTFAGNPAVHTTVDGTGTASARFFSPARITRDGSGNFFISDQTDHVIRKMTAAGVVTTFAGTAGALGNADGSGSAARFNTPYDMSFDASGNMFVCDYANGTIRKITPAAVVTTFAGEPEHPGTTDATGSAARFNYPDANALDGSGNLFVADFNNHTIRKVTPAGVVTTFAGSAGQEGSTDGTGSAARFSYPQGVVVDSSGNLYISSQDCTIRKITPAGVVTTVAGTAGSAGYDDGPGSSALFGAPTGMAFDSSGNLFVADPGGNNIRKITPGNVVSTFAGSTDGLDGSVDGTGTAARFNLPGCIAIDASNNLYVTDYGNHTIRKITPAGVVTTLLGSTGVNATVDGTGSAVRFSYPYGIAIDTSGNLYVTEPSNTVRFVTPAGVVTTIGGTPGVAGGADGIGAAAQFNNISGIAVSPNGSAIYVTDSSNNRISKGAIASSAPTVTTPTSASITGTSATLGGNVTSDGGATITERGVVYSVTSTNSNPQIGGTGVTNVSTTGTTGVFAISSGALTPGTAYSFAAYATNSAGTGYSSVGTFTTPTTVSSLNLASASPTNAATINWTLTFASAVTGVTASNFSLSGTGTSGASVGTPSTSNNGLTWTVPVTTGSSGTLTLSLANTTGLSYFVSTPTPFAGQTCTVDKLTQTPTLTAPALNGSSGNPVSVNYTLPEDAQSGSVKLSFAGSSTVTLTLSASNSTSGTHTFSFNPANIPASTDITAFTSSFIADGSYAVTLSYQDALGNTIASSASATNFTLDTITQSPTLTSPATNGVSGSPFTVSFSLPETAANSSVKLIFTGSSTVTLTLASSQQSSGPHSFSLDATSLLSSNVASATASSLPNGTYTVTLSYQDLLGNTAASSSATNFTLGAPPTVTTPTSTSITASSATVGATVTAGGSSSVSSVGILLSTNAGAAFTLPPGAGVRVIAGLPPSVPGSFSVAVSSLMPATTYYYVAYAANADGTGYTTPVASFTTTAGAASVGSLPFAQFVDPHPAAGNQFGFSVTPLPNGNVVITAPFDDSNGTDTGAIYLFNGATGALISEIHGSTTNDRVGNGAVTVLTNGNFVARSVNWSNGASAASAGAITWGSATTGVSGVVGPTNSLLGTATSDGLGSNSVVALPNGNYVVSSPLWDNGGISNAGAVTLGNGSTGTSGYVGAANSLVGSTATDGVGSAGIVVLSNGNYVVKSPNWNNGATAKVGAATWASGSTGISGAVSAANSLIGATANDQVTLSPGGTGNGVTALATGNYVVVTLQWDNGSVVDAGAVTWCDGTTGRVGVVSTANSLVGSQFDDRVGVLGAVPLPNGNYVVTSPRWDNGSAVDAGAVTFVNGSNGFIYGTSALNGAVSTANSLVGSTASDLVGGNNVVALTNSNYVVPSNGWTNGSAAAAGAVTWCNGTTGMAGVVSTANSLVGTTTSDNVGMTVYPLANGHYVVRSMNWNNGAATKAGAATWCSGYGPTSATVSTANSLVGSQTNDTVSSGGLLVLPNGNYVVPSESWANGAASKAGAATWGNGVSGTSGVVSAANSLVGSTANDQISALAILAKGNYLAGSSIWDNGSAADAGAVAFGNGSTGTSGVISASNAVVGSTAADQVGGGGITLLANGGYVLRSAVWDNGVIVNAGAATFGNGSTGISGTVSSANSLVGTSATDNVGTTVTAMPDGSYVVTSANWDNASAGVTDAGAITWGSATTGISGPVTTSNSVVGISATSTAQPSVGDSVNGVFYARLRNESNSSVTTGTVRLGLLSNGSFISPIVSAPTSAAITSAAATLGGTVLNDNGTGTTTRGVVLAPTATNNNPTIGGPGVTNLSTTGGLGSFTTGATGLASSTGYTFKAYATSTLGTSYSSAGTFTTLPGLSNNADLSNLTLSSGTLNPTFASGTTSYAVTVLRSVASMTVTPTVAESHATVQARVNGGSYSSVTSGSASSSLALNLGANTIDVLVTAQDGTTTKTYTVNVTRRTFLEAWRNQYFSTIANSGNAADTATPQNDGLPNLLKFATGMNPTSNGVQPIGIVKNGSNLEFTYPRSVEATAECTFIVEWSDTLLSGSWVATGVTENVLSDNGTLQQVKAIIPASGVDRRFVRLRVTNP